MKITKTYYVDVDLPMADRSTKHGDALIIIGNQCGGYDIRVTPAQLHDLIDILQQIQRTYHEH